MSLYVILRFLISTFIHFIKSLLLLFPINCSLSSLDLFPTFSKITVLHHSTMGNLTSSPSHTLYTQSLPGLSPFITHIVARPFTSSPTPNNWSFVSRINFQPIVVGQRVALYHNAADCCDPDPLRSAVVEGHIDAIVNASPNWITFCIYDALKDGPVFLGILYVFISTTHYQRLTLFFTQISHRHGLPPPFGPSGSSLASIPPVEAPEPRALSNLDI